MFKRRDAGFSLLEIIIVMAIAGGLLTMYTRYVRKQAERSSQRNISAALVQEMKGIIHFVREPDMVIINGDSGSAEEITNPLYNTDTTDADYQVRLSSDVNDVDTGGASEYYLWGDGSDASQQQRYRFISSSCKVTAPKSSYAFEKEYLPCWMSGAAKNAAAHIDRIGFRGSDLAGQEGAINQIDVIVEFGADNPDSLLAFARFQPALAQAFSDAGEAPAHAWLVHRESTNADWQLVTKNNDQKTPIEFDTVASNIASLTDYTSGEFGVRFTFDLNDNDSGDTASGSGGDMCWNSTDSKVEMCFDKNEGTGAHGEDAVLALNMKDAGNTHGDQKLGTLQANLVMENTARKVYIFQRSYNGNLVMDSAGQPALFRYEDANSQSFIGEYYINDVDGAQSDYSDSERNIYNYVPDTYDAFELVTPTITDYVTHGGYDSDSFETKAGYFPKYDDSVYGGNNIDRPNVRYPVQTCPQVEQTITLRNGNGEALVDADGNPREIKILRKLFPRLSVAVSSVSAYRAGVFSKVYDDPSRNREKLNDSVKVGQLAGITVQVEFAVQNLTGTSSSPGLNAGKHVIYKGYKYIWIIGATLGMYDGDTGEGVNVVDPNTISYTVSRWCSTIPQPGTPADLLDSSQYQ